MRDVFAELTEELLDLTVTEKGVGNAIYAQVDDGCGSGACSSSSALCISLCCSYLCW
jgi:hypothetical protein